MVQPRVVDLHVELPQIRTLLSRLMPETIVVDASIDAEVWPIEIDPVQLTQVLINLAINGRDAMPRGGRLSLHVGNRVLRYLDTLAPGDTPPGDYVVLERCATTAAACPRRCCSRRPSTRSSRPRRWARAPAWASPRRGRSSRRPAGSSAPKGRRGAAPRSASSCPAPPRPRSPPRWSTTPRSRRRPAGSTALVVEDNDAVRATLVELLTSNGYEVVAAIDGEQALEIVRSVPAPLGFLVTDMMLPGMSGLDVARAIQARWPACRVLFITGYLDLDAAQRAAAGRLPPAEAVLPARAPRRAGQAARRLTAPAPRRAA